MRPHVVMMLPSLQPGGMENVAVELVRGLADSFRVSVLCFDGLGPLSERLPAGVEVALVPRRAGRDWRFPLRVRRWLRERAVDVLHAHNPTALFYGAGAVWGLRTRVVFTDHGRAVPLGARSCWAIRRVARRADRAVAVAPHLLDTLRESYGFRERQLRWIPNGVSIARFANDGEVRSSSVGGGPRIGTVGRLAEGKEQHVLLQAAARLLPDHPGLQVDLVGDGPLRRELEQVADRLGMAELVRFHGSCVDVPRRLRSFDVFVHPSRAEGMPMVVLEAMAAGLPVICSDIPGHRGVLGDPPCGVLFPAGDVAGLATGLADLLRDRARAAALSTAAAARCRATFSTDAMIAAYRAVFDEVSAEGR